MGLAHLSSEESVRSERERAALAVVADGGFDAGLGRRRLFEPNIAAMALAGVAWLTLVLGMRWQLRTKAVAALSGLATLALAGATAIGDADTVKTAPSLGCCC